MTSLIRKWFKPSHRCTIFRNYYGLNKKICADCGKEHPIGEAHFIKHQR